MGRIVGIQLKHGKTDVWPDVIDRMLAQINYRADVIMRQRCGLNVFFSAAYCKNVSASKQIVAFDESKKLCVCLDGDVFFKGVDTKAFSSYKVNSDAENLLALYEAYGIDLLRDIDGSYAIAIWDGSANKLVLVRDRVGSKPLFYINTNNGFVFASEIRAIIASGLYHASVKLRTVNNFLSYGYVPSPETLFESIRQVKPGHILIYENGNVAEKPYWNFVYRQDEPDRPESYYKKTLLDTLETGVSRRLKRHPDAGAFLSGGLDTSAVVSIMHKLKQSYFKVFSVGFEEDQYNEIPEAKMLADHFGLEHHTITVKFDNDFPSLLEKLVWHHDTPFADTSAIPSYYAAKLAKEHVDVVFTGDFPDQLLGGSSHHAHALYRQSHDPVWKKTLRNKKLNQLVTRLPWRAGENTFLDKAKRFLYRETFSLEEQRIVQNMPIPPLLKRCLYSPDLLKVNEEHDPLSIAQALYREVGNADLLDKLLYFDILSYAPDDLMVKVDRMTQAHGLTAISPFHDLELIEFIATLPTHLKIRGSERKYIMREALRPLLPEQTLNKKKQGFAMPIGEWLTRNLSDYVRDVLLDSRTLNRGYFNKKFMRKMVENFLAGKTDYASGSEAAIISLITLELWHRIFIDT
jgi:asparagine synthase (glutamine-hydrolysing)